MGCNLGPDSQLENGEILPRDGYGEMLNTL
jgi:hypothetical protein